MLIEATLNDVPWADIPAQARAIENLGFDGIAQPELRRDPVLPLFRAARVERFAYDVEILYLARKAGIRVLEVPVVWRDAPGSKVNALSDSFDMLRDVLRIVLRDRRGRYGTLGDGPVAARGAP